MTAANITPGEAVATLWDVAVIGAGPAGALSARGAARAGLNVLLLDRVRFPRPKVCGCCLNQHALSALAQQGLGGLPHACGAVPLQHLQLGASGRTQALALPDGVALSRETLDTALIDEAQRAGVHFLDGVAVKGVQTTDGAVVLTLPDHAVRARLLVDASGLNSQLTDRAVAVREGSRIGAGTALPAETAGYPAGTIFMATGRGGYVGLVRVEDGRLDVAAALDRRAIAEAGEIGTLAAGIVAQSGLPPLPQLAAADWKGTPALTRSPRRVAGERWFAVGDAAGYIEPFTGEGMAWALAGAASLVPLLQDASAAWQPAHADAWARLHRQHIGQRQWACRFLAALLRSPLACRLLVPVLGVFPRLANPFVRSVNRPAELPGVP